jgi:hypothetical protein
MLAREPGSNDGGTDLRETMGRALVKRKAERPVSLQVEANNHERAYVLAPSVCYIAPKPHESHTTYPGGYWRAND